MNQSLTKQTKNEQFFKEVCDSIRESLKTIESQKTPKEFIYQMGDFDYVDVEYMKRQLNKYYPLWNWEIVHPPIVVSNVVIVTGTLTIVTENGVTRKCSGIGASQFKTSSRTGNLLPPSSTVKTANTEAFKKAINDLLNICADVYKKDTVIIIEQLLSLKEHPVATKKTWELIDKKIESTKADIPTRRNEIFAYYNYLKKILDEQLRLDNEQKENLKEKERENE